MALQNYIIVRLNIKYYFEYIMKVFSNFSQEKGLHMSIWHFMIESNYEEKFSHYNERR